MSKGRLTEELPDYKELYKRPYEMVETDKMRKVHQVKKALARLTRSGGATTQLQPTAELQKYFCGFQLCRFFKSSISKFFHEISQSLN